MKYNTQNAKIESITEKTLIVGIDVGSETHYARAFDWRNYEYSKKPLEFSNNEAGFVTFKAWMEELAEKYGKDVVIPGMEPTGHYWFNLGAYLQDNGMKPVHVNPHHVKKSKELDDNNPNKNDRKDPKTIAALVNEGRFSNENNEKIKAINEREKAEEQLQTEIETTYSFVKKIISGSFCRQLEYIDNIGINRWLDIDEFYHELGKKQGYNEDIINNSVFEFIEIYAYFGRYRASYRYMVSMAKENDTWVYINESTFKWACEQNLGWQVINAMENRLKNNKIRYEHIKDYEEKISKLKKIRGF